MIKKIALVSIVSVAVSSTAIAKPQAGDWYLSPQVGGAYMDSDRNVEDTYGAGLGVGRWINEDWRYGLSFNHFGTKSETTHKEFSVRSIDFQVAHYPVEFGSKTRGFIMAGVGAWLAPGRPEMNSGSRFADVGLGIDYTICDHWSVTLDGRRLFNRGGGHSYADKMAMLSFNYAFPKSSKHEIRKRARLQEKLKSAGILPRMSATLFGFDSTSVSIADEEALIDMMQYLEANPKAKLLVEGHADGRGKPQYNRKLAMRRAEAFKDYVLDSSSVNEEQLVVRSKGEKFPVADNATEEGRAKNRRVEVQVIPEGIDIDDWS